MREKENSLEQQSEWVADREGKPVAAVVSGAKEHIVTLASQPAS